MTSARTIGRVAVPLLAAGGAVQWWVGQAPLLALVASYVAILLLAARVLPVRVAVSAALLAQLGGYLVLLALIPLVVGGPMRPGVALAILLAPCLALAGELLRGRPAEPTSEQDSERPPWWQLAAAATGGVVMVAAVLLAGRGRPYGSVAWTTSGDARNHLMDAHGIISAGGLHGRWLTDLPMYQEGLVALLINTHGRNTLAPGALLRHDLHGYALSSLALTVLWTLATTALLLGLGALRGRAITVVIVAASLLPLTGLALGVAIRDGFVPILLLQPLLLCTIAVLAWLATTDDTGTPVTVAIGATAVALPLAATTWTPYFAVLAAACVLPWLRHLRSGRQRPARLGVMLVGGAAGSAICLSVIASTDGYLTLLGSIAAPSPATALLVPLAVLVLVVGGWSSVEPRAFLPFLAGSVAVLGIVAYAVAVQPPDLAWNYYPSKVAWIWTVVALPLLLVPFAHPRASVAARPAAHARTVTVVAGAAGVLLAGTAFSTVGSPVLPSALSWSQTTFASSPTRAAWTTIGDWAQPTGDSLRLAVRLGDPHQRYVLYHYDPAEDRITNFWLAPYDTDGIYDDEVLYRWAYHELGRPEDICSLLGDQPDRIVLTADPSAEAELEATCGAGPLEVRLLSSPK